MNRIVESAVSDVVISIWIPGVRRLPDGEAVSMKQHRLPSKSNQPSAWHLVPFWRGKAGIVYIPMVAKLHISGDKVYM